MRLLFKIFDALKVIVKSKRKISSFFKKGASIASTQVLYSLRKYVQPVNTIIDVGANQGQFALASTHFFPSAKIYSFEPVPQTFNALKKNTKSSAAITVYNFALGNSEGTIDFYSNEYSHASSALPVSQQQKDLLPQTSKEHKIKVTIKKLDEIFDGLDIVSPVLLKLDVQGFEKDVLLGASQSLKKIDYLLFEASFAKMYDGEPLFDEMHSFVKELGFELVAPVGFLQSDNLQILQMDMLYTRSSR